MASKNPRLGQPERFDRYGYEKMDYDRLMRESFHLKDSAEYAMSLGRKDPELRQKITALQQEFARRGFTAASTVLNAFLRKSFSRPGAKDKMAVEDRFYFGKGRKERFANSPFEQISGQERLSDALTKMGSANAMLDVLAYFARQYGKERIVKAVRNTYSSARAQEILSKLFATI